MVFWQSVKFLWPTLLIHAVFVGVLSLAVWRWLSRSLPAVAKNGMWIWTGFFVFCFVFSDVIHVYQTFMLATSQASDQTTGQTEAQIRTKFLQAVESMMNSPQNINEQTKASFQKMFAPVFSNAEIKKTYYTNISNLLICNRSFTLDAISSYEKKKEVVSQDRKTCETLSGEFFGRKTILPEPVVTQNLDIIKKMADTKRKPAQTDKDIPKIEDLRQTLKNQEIGIQVVQFLFN